MLETTRRGTQRNLKVGDDLAGLSQEVPRTDQCARRVERYRSSREYEGRAGFDQRVVRVPGRPEEGGDDRMLRHLAMLCNGGPAGRFSVRLAQNGATDAGRAERYQSLARCWELNLSSAALYRLMYRWLT